MGNAPLPRFLDNLGQCCGSAGVAGFFLDLGKLTGDSACTDYSRRVVRNLLSRATPTPGDGSK